MPEIGTKNGLFGYIWGRILEHYCHIWNQHLRISIITKFCEETTMPKFGTKSALFGNFFTKNALLGHFFARVSKILSSYLKSAPSDFAKKQKYLNLGWKMPYLCFFGVKFKKAIVIFEIST